MTRRTATLLAALLLLGACGKSDNQPAPKLYKQERDALDKAKGVGPALQQQEDKQRQELEKQEQ
jgi:hypothetical protein